jgi:hypothetical protein
MPRGLSGRIVLEIDPSKKDLLYIALAKNKLTLKDWFIVQCDNYLNEYNQLRLFNEEAAENPLSYKGDKK